MLPVLTANVRQQANFLRCAYLRDNDRESKSRLIGRSGVRWFKQDYRPRFTLSHLRIPLAGMATGAIGLAWVRRVRVVLPVMHSSRSYYRSRDCSILHRSTQSPGGNHMNKLLAAVLLSAPLVLLPALGAAKGCLKGAAVGGVAGHVAGHHAVAGAAAGCIIQHHREKVRDRAAAQPQQTPAPPPQRPAVPQTQGPSSEPHKTPRPAPITT